MRKEILRLDNVTYMARGIRYLDMFRMHMFSGEILGVFFMQYHGKRELVEIISENLPIDFGKIYLEETLINSYANDANGTKGTSSANGRVPASVIGYQDTLVDDMTVAENVYLLRPYVRTHIINNSMLFSQFAILADEFGLDIDGYKLASELNELESYKIMLLRAVISGTQLIILEDMDNLLDGEQLQDFNHMVRSLSEQGISFLCVSDHYGELTKISDRILIIDHGQVTSTLQAEQFDKFDDPDDNFNQPVNQNVSITSECALKFNHVYAGEMKDFDFQVNQGECVLMWDQHNKVTDDIIDFLSGASLPVSGSIELFGGLSNRKSMMRNENRNRNRKFRRKFIGKFQSQYAITPKRTAPDISIILGDPTTSMVIGDITYFDNLCMHISTRDNYLWTRHLHRKSIYAEYSKLIGSAIDLEDPFDASRNDLYKMVYYREYLYNPKLLVLVRPFANTDADIQVHITALIAKFQERGTTVLILDNNPNSSLVLYGRIIVVSRGKIVQDAYNNEGDAWDIIN